MAGWRIGNAHGRAVVERGTHTAGRRRGRERTGQGGGEAGHAQGRVSGGLGTHTAG